ncbi:MAG: hypothetical protein ABW019_05275 [Chitinophagaceae bacterium]
MKPILLTFLVGAIFAACSTPRPSQTAADAVTVITVEYRYDPSTAQTIRQLLRRKRVADWMVSRTDTEQTVEARYPELSAADLGEIDTRLRELPAVLRIDVRRDGVPVKNSN